MSNSESQWYKSWFGKDYLKIYSHRNQSEAKQLVQLILSNIKLNPDAFILDICCGQGRHLSIFAEHNFKITGIDLSPTLLKIAKENIQKYPRANIVQADMRYIPFNSEFDLILNLFTSFGYFQKDESNKSVFLQISRLLKKSGYFVFDYFNSAYVKKNLVPSHKEDYDGIVVEQRRFIENSRVKKKIELTKDGKKSTFMESVKLYTPDEIFDMLHSVNLKVNRIFGNYDGSKFDDQSPRLLVFGEKNV